MSAFPMFAELDGKPCLVVGGGGVARRKAEALVSFGGKVTVVAPEVQEELKGNPGVTVMLRPFREEDLQQDFFLVIAASDDFEVNARVTEACQARRIPVNRADEGGQGGFLFPALVKKGDLTIGISTGGASPRAAGFFRRIIEAALPEKTGQMLAYLNRTREKIKTRHPKGEVRRALLEAVAEETLQKGEPLTETEEARLFREAEAGKRPVGRVYLVGAGCGSADLITVRGLRLIQTCDAIVYDELIDKALLDAAPARAEKIPMGKRAGGVSARQEDIHAELIRLAREGKTVVRLKGGDPYLFGRGGEELLAMKAAGIPCDEVPGIPSAIGIPAEYDIPVTHRSVSRSLHIITAHTADSGGLPPDMEKYARLEGTLVFLMGLGKLEAIAGSLMENGKAGDTPAAVLSGGNAPNPACIRGTLETISKLAKDARPPAIILVGPVAGELER